MRSLQLLTSFLPLLAVSVAVSRHRPPEPDSTTKVTSTARSASVSTVRMGSFQVTTVTGLESDSSPIYFSTIIVGEILKTKSERQPSLNTKHKRCATIALAMGMFDGVPGQGRSRDGEHDMALFILSDKVEPGEVILYAQMVGMVKIQRWSGSFGIPD